MATVEGIRRLAICLACGNKIKVEAGPRTVNCAICGLTLANATGLDRLAPIVVPRAGEQACWKALAQELRLPDRDGAVALRESRLLMVPYWRWAGDAAGGAGRGGSVISGAELAPIGLPSLTRERGKVRGLGVEEASRTGDAMGRLADGAAGIEAIFVDPFFGPDGASAESALAASPATPGWRLIYHPAWSFRYAVFSKEHYHVVDGVTAKPIGPARRVRWPVVSALPVAATLVCFLAGAPWLGAAAALPAWIAGTGLMRALLRRERAVS
jgi:hypothetical protein